MKAGASRHPGDAGAGSLDLGRNTLEQVKIQARLLNLGVEIVAGHAVASAQPAISSSPVSSPARRRRSPATVWCW